MRVRRRRFGITWRMIWKARWGWRTRRGGRRARVGRAGCVRSWIFGTRHFPRWRWWRCSTARPATSRQLAAGPRGARCTVFHLAGDYNLRMGRSSRATSIWCCRTGGKTQRRACRRVGSTTGRAGRSNRRSWIVCFRTGGARRCRTLERLPCPSLWRGCGWGRGCCCVADVGGMGGMGEAWVGDVGGGAGRRSRRLAGGLGGLVGGTCR